MSAKKETLFSEKLPEPEMPWWRDDLKVVESAIRRARSNAAVRRRLRSLLKTWAQDDEAFRRELQAELVALGAGRRGNDGNPLWQDMMLVKTIEVWRSPEMYGTIKAACAHLAGEDVEDGQPMFDGIFGTNSETIAKRYRKALRRLSERK